MLLFFQHNIRSVLSLLHILGTRIVVARNIAVIEYVVGRFIFNQLRVFLNPKKVGWLTAQPHSFLLNIFYEQMLGWKHLEVAEL